jgi:methylamine dehydrogenase heavy chain
MALLAALGGAFAVLPVSAGAEATAGVSTSPYDAIIGETRLLGTPDAHWFAAVGRNIAYLIDGDAGEVRGSLTLSNFTPALAPALDDDRIYAYGSFYTRGSYGEREDIVQVFDLQTTLPVNEVPIPPKSAGIGHSGMIGLIAGRFIGVWNITPAMSVSLVDTVEERFLAEISTPGCAGVYPLAAGFLMACGDGRAQYLRLDAAGSEVARSRSEVFFSTSDDPVFDYAVPTDRGWLFLSLEGQLFEVTVDGDSVAVSAPWSINPADEPGATDINGVALAADDDWRVGGSQPFAYNAATGLLVTLMHQGGGQETFEDAGTQIWAFSTRTQRRGYVITLDEGQQASAVQLTGDDQPLLLVSLRGSGELQLRDGLSGRLLRRMADVDAGKLQRLQ